MNRQTDQQVTMLREAGYEWNSDRNCWINQDRCIFETNREGEFQIGRIEEETPVKAEGVFTLEMAILENEQFIAPIQADESAELEVDDLTTEHVAGSRDIEEEDDDTPAENW